MTLTDVMLIFRRIIGVIARVSRYERVRVEYVAQDLEVDKADLRFWLTLMDLVGVVTFLPSLDVVTLDLMKLNSLGFDVSKLEDL